MITWIIVGGIIIVLLTVAYSIFKVGGEADERAERIYQNEISNRPK